MKFTEHYIELLMIPGDNPSAFILHPPLGREFIILISIESMNYG